MSDKTTISIYRKDAAEWGKICTLLHLKSPEMFKAVLKLALDNKDMKHHLEHGDMGDGYCLLSECSIHYPEAEKHD